MKTQVQGQVTSDSDALSLIVVKRSFSRCNVPTPAGAGRGQVNENLTRLIAPFPSHLECGEKTKKNSTVLLLNFFRQCFLAPIGAQGVTMSVRPSVCSCGTKCSRALNFHLSGSDL